MSYSIYLVTNAINGKIYVGYTKRTPEQRLRLHVRDSMVERAKNRAISRAIRKYGKESFSVVTLETVETLEEAKVREMHHIKTRKSTDCRVGYNMTAGGDGPPSEEVVRKRSEAMRGRKMSDESRRKMSLAKTGDRHPFWGKKRPDLSLKLTGRPAKKGADHSTWRHLPVEEVVSLYRSGVTTRDIAKSMNCDHTTIMDRLVAEGVKLRTRVEFWEMRRRLGVERQKQRKRTSIMAGSPE